MGEVDTQRQALNVARMKLLGAEVIPVEDRQPDAQGRDQRGAARLGRQRRLDALHARYGGRRAPVPRHGARLRPRHRRRGPRSSGSSSTGRLPDAARRVRRRRLQRDRPVHGVHRRRDVRLYGFEPGGDGFETGRHAATITAGQVGVLHGARSFLLQDEDGQTIESHSISAGLDYPGVGPEHAWLAETGRATYRPITDAEAMDAMALLARTEGIIPAIERPTRSPARSTSPASWAPTRLVLVSLSGRGDKDMDTAATLVRSCSTRSRRSSRSDALVEADVRREAARGPGGPGRLPAGGLPPYVGALDALQGDGRRRRRRGRDRTALLRPGDGRSDDPGAAERGAGGRHAHARRLRTVEAVAATGVPTLVMTYWNPVERYGVERFAADLAAAGVAGLITPDLIPDEAAELDRGGGRARTWTRCSWSRRPRPTSGCAMTADACRGFVYATAVMGVTGARDQTSEPRAGTGGADARGHRPAGRRRARASPTATQAAGVAAFADAVDRRQRRSSAAARRDDASPARGRAARGRPGRRRAPGPGAAAPRRASRDGVRSSTPRIGWHVVPAPRARPVLAVASRRC